MFKMNFLRWKTNAALKHNKTPRASMPYAQAKSIGIIFTVEDKQKHDDVKSLINILERDGKKVSVIEFLPEKKDNYEFKFDFFTIKDLSFWGNIESSTAIEFARKSFDYLLCLDRDSNPLILNLLAKCKAHCRVGCHSNGESNFYELMIERPNTNRDYINALYTYTSQLK